VNVVYDAGALIAADGNDRAVWAEHRAELELGGTPVTTAPVVAQVSRSPRQARLRMFLRGCEIVPFDADQAHAVGALLAASGTGDVVDAHLALVGAGAEILTSDPHDLEALAALVPPRPTIRPV
jgi:hypothetical protein